jgi:hypothetical protein
MDDDTEFDNWDEQTHTKENGWVDSALDDLPENPSSNSIISLEKCKKYYSNLKHRTLDLDEK